MYNTIRFLADVLVLLGCMHISGSIAIIINIIEDIKRGDLQCRLWLI